MLAKDLITETFTAINANRTRSALTILGIVIGIGSVIAMISIGQGAQSSITDQIESGGANTIMISPSVQGGTNGAGSSQGSAQSLTLTDAKELEKLDLVEAISPEVSSRYQVIAKENNINASVNGIEPGYQTVNNVDLDKGMFITDHQVKGISKVAVLGSSIAVDLFGENDPVGESIRINSINFKITGVLENTGAGFNSPDDMILIPLSVAQRYFTGDQYLSSINVKIIDAEAMEQAESEITFLLMQLHNISTENEIDFRVRNIASMVEMASSVTGTLTVLLGSIAGISLLVGGIGIMNMMLTSVTERTREIGLRKAIGAKSRDINIQFLAESVMLTFSGGIIGIIFGYTVSYFVSNFLNTATSVTSYSVILAFGVSVGVGIIFGYYPARRAAKLNPIEALRYE